MSDESISDQSWSLYWAVYNDEPGAAEQLHDILLDDGRTEESATAIVEWYRWNHH